MKFIRRYLGLLLLVMAPVILFAMIYGAIQYIDPAGTKEINNPVIWVIIIAIFSPIVIGLMLFGWYAFRGEFDRLPEKSAEL